MRRNTSLQGAWSFTCTNWEKPPAKLGFSTLEPRTAVVPGYVHLDLMREGIIADPFESCHELGCQWVDEQDFSYCCTFRFEPDPTLPMRLLRFEGLDTVSRVYLNDHLIASHDNQFLPLEIEVTAGLLAGENKLRVEFDSAVRVGLERRARYFADNQIAEHTVRMDARAFVRKAQYMYGWDWGPSLVSAGIYRPVSIVEHAGRLLDVRVEQRHLPVGAVELRFTSQFEALSGDVAPRVYHFIEGIEGPLADGQWHRIVEPRLWWPNGMGTPELYQVDSGLFAGEPRTRQNLEQALDVKSQRVGLRTIEVRQDLDAWGKSFRFRVNGRECYALGANYIPDDNFISRVDSERLKSQLERAVELRMNMLRVWGGGFYETDEFYDLCDELGLLVWQDFPYACSYYPDDDAACEVARLEAKANILRLRNHPCLAIWCGNNENQAMRDDGWEGPDRQPKRYEGERIYDGVLPALLSELDPSRCYIPTSPFGEGRANSGKDGDQHFWEVWHGKGDWKFYLESDARFCSEFGFASAPGHATWMALDKQRPLLTADVRDPVARWHDKTAKGYETFLAYVELHYPKSSTIEQWTYYSQLNQRDALRFGIEHFRRSEFCRGTLIWQLNDCWPVQSWAVIDSSFHYKAAAYEIKRLYAPLLMSVLQVGMQLEVWGILDNTESQGMKDFVLELRSLRDGSLLRELSAQANIAPGERRRLLECSLEGLTLEETLAVARVDESVGYRLLAEPKDVKLPASVLRVALSKETVTVTAPGPVVDLCLWDEGGGARFLDNFVTLVEPGSITLRYHGDLTQLSARSLGGRHELVLES